MAALPLIAMLAGFIAPTATANGTTLPFQRHVVHVGPDANFLAAAVQKQGSESEGLVLYVSSDRGATWHRDQAIQKDAGVRDTSDLLRDPDGQGFALVYSVEPQMSRFGPYANSSVVYLHYRMLPDGTLGADFGPVTIFQPGNGQGFFRASITRDARGVLHCGATYMNGSDYRYLVRSSNDSGLSWTAPAQLEWFGGTFGGGRVIAFADGVAAILDDYSATAPGRFSTRPAGPEGAWSPVRPFAWDGLYHAGAFSVVATTDGHLHLGYSEKTSQQLRYREFDGASWSAPITLEERGSWSNQPALSAAGNAISFAWNHSEGPDQMQIVQRTRVNGVWSPWRTVASWPGFKGYTTAIEEAEPGGVPILWSEQPHMNSGAASIVSATAPLP